MYKNPFFCDKPSHIRFLFFTFWPSSFELVGSGEFPSNDKIRESFEDELDKIFISNEKESNEENKGLLFDEEGLNYNKELSSIEINKGKSDIHLSFRQVSFFDNSYLSSFSSVLHSQNLSEAFLFFFINFFINDEGKAQIPFKKNVKLIKL